MHDVLLLTAIVILAFGSLALAQSGEPGRPQVYEGVKVHYDIPFAKVDIADKDGKPATKDLLLDLYLPRDHQAPGTPGAAKAPVILWVHGGGWVEGNRNRLWIPWITVRGYALASIEYRLSGEAIWPAQIHDCKAAVRWLRANADKYGLDADRIAAAGDSAGGHLAAMLGVTGGMKELEGEVGGNLKYSSKVQCVIDFFGPADLAAISSPRAGAAGRAGGGLLGRRSENDDPAETALLAERAKQASPITHASKNAAPMLIIHGDSDPLVSPEHSRKLFAALEKAGADVKLVEIPGGQHGKPFPDYYESAAARERILTFFDRHLRDKDQNPTTATAPAK